MTPIVTREISAETPKLSIIILTIPGRKEKFNRLISELKKQCAAFPDQVEVISVYDDKSNRIGRKRQIGIQTAKGLFTVFIDDDDFISHEYIQAIVPILSSEFDCVGFKVECEFKDLKGNIEEQSKAIISNRFDDWYHEKFEKINGEIFKYRQMIYHKSPVLTEFVKQVGFKDMVKGEDYDFAKRLKPLLKNEYFIDKYLYMYNFQKEKGVRYAR